MLYFKAEQVAVKSLLLLTVRIKQHTHDFCIQGSGGLQQSGVFAAQFLGDTFLCKVGWQCSAHKGKACQIPAIFPFSVVERNLELSKRIRGFQRLPKDILSLQNQPIFEIIESVIRCTAVDDTGRGNQLRTVCYPAVFLPCAVEAD